MTTLEEAIANGRGAERPFNCHAHDDSNASATVNVDRGVWFCHGCHAKGSATGRFTPSTEAIVRALSGEAKPRVYAERWLDFFDGWEASPYWAGRYSPEVALAHRCGSDAGGNPTYPLRSPEGDVWGVVRRIGGDRKYLYPTGVPVSSTFYSVARGSDVVVLVEGASDVMAIDHDGIPKGWSVMGCYGAGLHAPQVELLRQLRPNLIVAAFDDDPAGQRAAAAAERVCEPFSAVVTHAWSKNDPGDMGKGERMSDLTATVSAAHNKKTTTTKG